MKLRLPTIAVALAMLGMLAVSPAAAASSSAAAAPATTVTGTIAQASGGGTFTGTLTNIVVKNVDGVLTATGTLNGTLTTAAGTVLQVVNQVISLPAAATGTCTILTLTLGPLDLNLLGLMVHLNQVVLNVTAQSGPGNLLGNLLCAVAHLLDNGGPLSGIAGLLSNLLGHL